MVVKFKRDNPDFKYKEEFLSEQLSYYKSVPSYCAYHSLKYLSLWEKLFTTPQNVLFLFYVDVTT